MKYHLELTNTANQALPGFFGANIPRRAARGRQEDSLLIFLSQQSGEPFEEGQLRKWLENASVSFYKSSGSVTSAMRAAAFSLNASLAEKNLSLPPEHIPVSAQLSLGVIHHETLFLAQAGLSQVVLAKPGSRAFFFDADLEPRGLGLTQVPRLRFFQQKLDEGDVILFSTQFPVAFLAGSGGSAQPELSLLLAELNACQPLPAEVGLALARPGEGTARWTAAEMLVEPAQTPLEMTLAEEPAGAPFEAEPPPAEETLPQTGGELGASPEASPEPAQVPEDADGQPRAETDPSQTGVDQARFEPTPGGSLPQPAESEPTPPKPEARNGEAEASAAVQPAASPVFDDTQPTFTADQLPAESLADTRPRTARYYSEQSPEKKPRDRAAERALRKQRSQASFRKVAEGAGSMNKLGERVAAFLTGEKKQSGEGGAVSAEIPRGTKLLLAIFVPLLVVGLLSAVYFSQGRGNQYEYLLAQAQAAVDNAPLMQGAEAQREAWNQALSWLDQAEAYRQSSELRALRARAQNALDVLDGALRLAYKPAFAASALTGLDISRIVSVGTDLYLLDRATGVVLHLSPSNGAFVPDLSYNCKPGLYQGIQVGRLVDVISVPINNTARAPILALDANGNGLFCGVGKEPSPFALIPPDGGFGRIGTVLYDAGRLFILDPVKNALWIYRGANMEYVNPPDSYFEEQPIALSEAVSAAVSGDELFLLFADGHSSHCLASNVTGTVECADPYVYQDARGGMDGGALDFGALRFSQLSYSPPPDPSLYYLAAERAELYQFSLRLNLNRVLRSGASGGSLPARSVTAFNVGSNRNVYLAFGGELYYAVIP